MDDFQDPVGLLPRSPRIFSGSTWQPVADQSNCAGVGVGVAEGEGNSVGVEKFGVMGLLLGDGLPIGNGIGWG
jgi:hypothetical protein